jgi:Spy/CpxP family protein refolding chaperone
MKPVLSVRSGVPFFLVLLICTAINICVTAQTQSSTGVSHDHARRAATVEDQVKMLTEKLNLDSSQQTKVKAILENRQDQVHRIAENASLSAVDRFNAIKAVRERSEEQIGRILTPEQTTKFDQFRHRPPQAQPKPE